MKQQDFKQRKWAGHSIEISGKTAKVKAQRWARELEEAPEEELRDREKS